MDLIKKLTELRLLVQSECFTQDELQAVEKCIDNIKASNERMKQIQADLIQKEDQLTNIISLIEQRNAVLQFMTKIPKTDKSVQQCFNFIVRKQMEMVRARDELIEEIRSTKNLINEYNHNSKAGINETDDSVNKVAGAKHETSSEGTILLEEEVIAAKEQNDESANMKLLDTTLNLLQENHNSEEDDDIPSLKEIKVE